MSLWCILSAPLVASNDMTAMTPNSLALLSNSEVIAVDQDALGIQGHRVWQQGPLEVWVKPLADGGKAVAVFNRDLGTTPIPLRFKQIGVTGPIDARDLWSHTDLGLIKDGYVVRVPVHGAASLKLK
jgi:alpha-galactosidase